VTVAFGGTGRGYVCAARSGHGGNGNPANPDANRAVYVWRTDDGGRTYSAPVTLVEGIYSDHPWVAAGQDQASSGHNVYVAWGGGASHTAIEFTRSTDGGQSFGTPRRILPEASTPSLVSAGPQVAAGPGGLVCVVCDWTTSQATSGTWSDAAMTWWRWRGLGRVKKLARAGMWIAVTAELALISVPAGWLWGGDWPRRSPRHWNPLDEAG
jgi:hypothetical protein